MTGTILIYGATGYTGRLIAKAAADEGARPILAGRNLEKVKRVAEPLGLAARAFDLADPAGVDAGIKDVAVVLCVAGPFSATSRPMADACLRNRVHYLDITGEIEVFEALAARDAEASARGVMLLPGVGFDVVPSDCLAAHLKRRLPDATDLKLYLSLGANASRGTAKTMLESIAAGTRVRRRGAIISRNAAEAGSCDFGKGVKSTVQVSWGDVATAFYSTGIPNIEVHFEASPPIVALARAPSFVKAFLGLGFMQSLLKAQVDRMPEGPSEAARRAGPSRAGRRGAQRQGRDGPLAPEDAGGLCADRRHRLRRRQARRRRRGQARLSDAKSGVWRRLHPQFRRGDARGPQSLSRTLWLGHRPPRGKGTPLSHREREAAKRPGEG